jgi:hypothetical protein
MYTLVREHPDAFAKMVVHVAVARLETEQAATEENPEEQVARVHRMGRRELKHRPFAELTEEAQRPLRCGYLPRRAYRCATLDKRRVKGQCG